MRNLFPLQRLPYAGGYLLCQTPMTESRGKHHVSWKTAMVEMYTEWDVPLHVHFIIFVDSQVKIRFEVCYQRPWSVSEEVIDCITELLPDEVTRSRFKLTKQVAVFSRCCVYRCSSNGPRDWTQQGLTLCSRMSVSSRVFSVRSLATHIHKTKI